MPPSYSDRKFWCPKCSKVDDSDDPGVFQQSLLVPSCTAMGSWSREWHQHDLHHHPVPRVIRADGTLCGYGGGLWRKKWLLDHERRYGRKASSDQVGNLIRFGHVSVAARSLTLSITVRVVMRDGAQ